MADELYIEDMLEAPYRKEEGDRRTSDAGSDRHSKKSRDRRRSSSRSRKRSNSRERRKGSSHERRKRSTSRERRKRSTSRDRKKRSSSRDRDQKRREREKGRRSKDKDKDQWGATRYKSPVRERKRSRSRSKEKLPELTPEERDARTVVCMQLSSRIRARDLEEFFSSVGQVRDVKLITDNKTRKSKGIAYVEFVEPTSVHLAYNLSGEKLLGVPIVVCPSQAERNRVGTVSHPLLSGNSTNGPMRLYVGSLHYNISDEMVRAIFEPFGKIDDIKLIKDHDTGKSQGFGFITFSRSEDAKRALEQMNGFEIAGRPLKLNHVTNDHVIEPKPFVQYDADVADRAGYDLGATGRLQLMAKLAEGTNFVVPPNAVNALNATAAASGYPAPITVDGEVKNMSQVPIKHQQQHTPSIATQCFMLSNMFNPERETNPNFAKEIQDEVLEECVNHGGVLHIYVDQGSKGNVYVKCASIVAAVGAVNALHGRYFGGKLVTAAYIPVTNYHHLFPDSLKSINHLQPPLGSQQNFFIQ